MHKNDLYMYMHVFFCMFMKVKVMGLTREVLMLFFSLLLSCLTDFCVGDQFLRLANMQILGNTGKWERESSNRETRI